MPLHCLGYEDVVIHEALAEIAHNGILSNLGQQHHVVHSTLLHIVTLPVKTLLAALWMGVEEWRVSPFRGAWLGWGIRLTSTTASESTFLRYPCNG